MSGKYKDAEPPKEIRCRRCDAVIQISWQGEYWYHRNSGSTSCRENARDEREQALASSSKGDES